MLIKIMTLLLAVTPKLPQNIALVPKSEKECIIGNQISLLNKKHSNFKTVL